MTRCCELCESYSAEVLYRCTMNLQDAPFYLCKDCIEGVVIHNDYKEADFVKQQTIKQTIISCGKCNSFLHKTEQHLQDVTK